MPKSANQKGKLLYILKFLEENTDEKHTVTMDQIIDYLSRRGIEAERKSIYSDIEMLRSAGYEIYGQRRNKLFYYYMPDRLFELSEVKILVDAVNSFKFVTESVSRRIVKKLSNFTSKYQASDLKRETYIADRVKSRSASTLYNIDAIHRAIGENSKITFRYFEWNTSKGKTYRREGRLYTVSPWKLMLADGNYYLIAYDSEDEKLKHYRTDKMERVSLTEEKREGEQVFANKDMADYSSGVFGMFGGEFRQVDLQFSNRLANVVIDRFGQNIIITPAGRDSFKITVKVVPSGQFYGWLFGLGADAKILAPENVVQEYKKAISRVEAVYK